MILDAVDASSLFSASMTSSAQADAMQQRALSRGMDLLSGKNYQEALKSFQRSIAYAPRSNFAITAYQFIAQTHSKQNNSEGAINAYRQALKIDSTRSDIHSALGNIYYFNKDYSNAVQSYELAVRYDPGEANRYSLGQGYLANGQFAQAEEQFARVAALAPGKPSGAYGLGLVYEKQGQHEAAIAKFSEALSIQGDFHEAYSEMGYVFADSGRLDEATRIKEELADLAPSLSSQLGQYITTKTAPRITLAASATLNLTAGPGTPVSAMDAYLLDPGKMVTFSVEFNFSKEMDPGSVQNVLNWQIGRATVPESTTAYNYGMAIPDTEVMLAPHPVNVLYDARYQSATVFFSVAQNAAGNATLDLGHIRFKFTGKDIDGLAMSTRADQYTGFSGIA